MLFQFLRTDLFADRDADANFALSQSVMLTVVFHHSCDVNFDMECVCGESSFCGKMLCKIQKLGRDLISGVKLDEQEEPHRSPGGVF